MEGVANAPNAAILPPRLETRHRVLGPSRSGEIRGVTEFEVPLGPNEEGPPKRAFPVR